jgi:ABC-type amino acid transport substrate-binding protein
MIKLKLTTCVLALLSSTSVFAERTLSVCADEDMLPMSSSTTPGYENRIAELIGRELNANIEFAWIPHLRGGALRRLKGQDCDLVMGIPAHFAGIETSTPYLTSSFVVVHRKSDTRDWSDLDNPAWQEAKIGLEAIGREGSQPPIVESLVARGYTKHLVAFGASDAGPVNGQYAKSLINGDIDVAVTWGPFGGQIVSAHPKELVLSPILKDPKKPQLQFVYPISVGIRAGETDLKVEIDHVLNNRRDAVSQVLSTYGVPIVQPSSDVIN